MLLILEYLKTIQSINHYSVKRRLESKTNGGMLVINKSISKHIQFMNHYSVELIKASETLANKYMTLKQNPNKTSHISGALFSYFFSNIKTAHSLNGITPMEQKY